MKSPANGAQPSRDMVGAFFIPVFIALAQYWAAFRVIQKVPARPISDGAMYISQARAYQILGLKLHTSVKYLFEWGLYPRFLSWFDFTGLSDWNTASTHPSSLVVYAGQGLLLSSSTALFLFLSFRLIPGSLFKRAMISAFAGGTSAQSARRHLAGLSSGRSAHAISASVLLQCLPRL